MRRFVLLAAAAVAMLASSIAGAYAQQSLSGAGRRAGVQRGGASVGFIVGSVTNLGCVLRADGVPEDRYVATIRKVGLDLGITQGNGLGLGRICADRAARAGRSLRQLCRRTGQRHARCRRRRQRAGQAVRRIRSRCNRSACRARSASASLPDWKAWNFGREDNRSFRERNTQKEPVSPSRWSFSNSVSICGEGLAVYFLRRLTI